MKMLKKLSLTLVALIGLIAVGLWFMSNTFTDGPIDPKWKIQTTANVINDNAVTVRFTGTSTLLFDDGQTRWMTDGWFTRVGWLNMLGKIEPDLEAVKSGLAANKVDEMAAVIPFHSHFDHAMDAPEVARRTGALLIGSESTANIGRGWGLPESQIRILQDRQTFNLGKFIITPILTRHYHFPGVDMALLEETIDEPLVPPVSATAYKEGGSWALHVSHPLGRWMIIGSAGYVEGAFEGLEADTVFLGVGGLGGQTAEYRETYWRESVEAVKAKRVVPIHWDSLAGSLDKPLMGQALFFHCFFFRDFSLKGDELIKAFLKTKERESAQTEDNQGVQFISLPRFSPVSLW